MERIHINETVERDGEIHLLGLPVTRGEHVGITLSLRGAGRPRMTWKMLAESDLVGFWKGREDIPTSPEFARRPRRSSQHRLFR